MEASTGRHGSPTTDSLNEQNILEEYHRAKEKLRECDENIKKFTGRDSIDARDRLGQRWQQPPSLGRGFDRRNEPPSRRGGAPGMLGPGRFAGGAYIRLGGGLGRGGRQEPGSDDEPENKPALQSSVMTPTGEKSRGEKLAEESRDGKGRDRNKRMFGMLLGTLQQFKSDSQQSLRSYKAVQRRTIEQKLDDKVKKEKEDMVKEREEAFDARKRQRHEIHLLERKMEMMDIYKQWEAETVKLMNFVRTQAKPPIFYLPKDPEMVATRRIHETRKFVTDMIERRKRKLSQDIDSLATSFMVEEKEDQRKHRNSAASRRTRSQTGDASTTDADIVNERVLGKRQRRLTDGLKQEFEASTVDDDLDKSESVADTVGSRTTRESRNFRKREPSGRDERGKRTSGDQRSDRRKSDEQKFGDRRQSGDRDRKDRRTDEDRRDDGRERREDNRDEQRDRKQSGDAGRGSREDEKLERLRRGQRRSENPNETVNGDKRDGNIADVEPSGVDQTVKENPSDQLINSGDQKEENGSGQEFVTLEIPGTSHSIQMPAEVYYNSSQVNGSPSVNADANVHTDVDAERNDDRSQTATVSAEQQGEMSQSVPVEKSASPKVVDSTVDREKGGREAKSKKKSKRESSSSSSGSSSRSGSSSSGSSSSGSSSDSSGSDSEPDKKKRRKSDKPSAAKSKSTKDAEKRDEKADKRGSNDRDTKRRRSRSRSPRKEERRDRKGDSRDADKTRSDRTRSSPERRRRRSDSGPRDESSRNRSSKGRDASGRETSRRGGDRRDDRSARKMVLAEDEDDHSHPSDREKADE